MKAVVAAINQEKTLVVVEAFSVITNLCVDLRLKLYLATPALGGGHVAGGTLALVAAEGVDAPRARHAARRRGLQLRALVNVHAVVLAARPPEALGTVADEGADEILAVELAVVSLGHTLVHIWSMTVAMSL